MKYPVLFALMTALFWGSYGPTLGQARSAYHSQDAGKKKTSPFKPYVMIGIAYIVWSTLFGLGGMLYMGDSFSFTGETTISGTTWAFAAGSLGALGAVNITLAMFSGGKAMPQIVMPIIFGGAVSVAAIVSVLTTKGAAENTSPWLWIGIAGIAVCIVIVAYNTPHGGPAHKPSHETASVSESQPAPPLSSQEAET